MDDRDIVREIGEVKAGISGCRQKYRDCVNA